MCSESSTRSRIKQDVFDQLHNLIVSQRWEDVISVMEQDLKYEWRECDELANLLAYIDSEYFVKRAEIIHFLLIDVIEILKRKLKYTLEEWYEVILLNFSSNFVEWLSMQQLLDMNHHSLEFISAEPESSFRCHANKFDAIDIHPKGLFTIKFIQRLIIDKDLKLLQLSLRKRFSFTEDQQENDEPFDLILARYNTDRFLLTFAQTYQYHTTKYLTEEEKQDLCDILYYLHKYFIYTPYRSSTKTPLFSLDDKRRIALNCMFLTGDPDLVEYSLQFIFKYKPKEDDERLIFSVKPDNTSEDPSEQFSGLIWNTYSNDVITYRRAEVYRISSKYKHPFLGYYLLYYEGNDIDLVSIQRQYYKERETPRIRKMSEFILE